MINFALIVLVFNIASYMHRMNQISAILLLQVAVFVIALFSYLARRGHTHPIPKPVWPRVQWKRDWPFTLLLAATAVMVIINFVFVLKVPPNNNDSLIIHLARVGMWHQQATWLPWETKVVWQLTFPLNAQLVAYWTLLFTNGEHLLGMFPYLCGLLSALLIYQLSMELTGEQKLALLAALVWLAFPVVQLNLTSTRHDHVSGFLLLACLIFLFSSLNQKNDSGLMLAGLGMGLAIGTNFAVIAYLPGFLLIILFTWLVGRQLTALQAVKFSASSALAFLVFSSPIFISNHWHFGTLLGPDALQMTAQGRAVESSSLVEHVFIMVSRWFYQILDPVGLPQPLMGFAFKFKALVFGLLADWLRLPLESGKALLDQHVFRFAELIGFSEDSGWFGLTGAVMVLIGIPVILHQAFRRKNTLLVWITIFLLSSPVMLGLVRSGWTPYDGRYFIPFMALVCVGGMEGIKKTGRRQQWVIALFSLVSVWLLIYALINNPAKALVGYRAFYQSHRYDMISAQSYTTKDMLYLVDQAVPEDGVLGLATQELVYYEYGLFGEHFTRTIIPVVPDERVCDRVWLDEKQIGHLLVDTGDGSYPGCTPAGFEYKLSFNRWIILERAQD